MNYAKTLRVTLWIYCGSKGFELFTTTLIFARLMSHKADNAIEAKRKFQASSLSTATMTKT